MKKLLEFKDFKPARDHSMFIKVLANGFTISIGCQDYVIGDLDTLMQELYSYFRGELTEFSEQFKNQLNLIDDKGNTRGRIAEAEVGMGPALCDPSPAPPLGG